MNRLRKIAPFLRAAALGICIIFLLAILSIQVEQRVLRRRAERLLIDIRSLEIHRATFSDVEGLGRKWKRLAHYESNCTERACALEISWDDCYLRHVGWLSGLTCFTSFYWLAVAPNRLRHK